ncbi:MAG: MarR family winged helix-turn-helix transcriptional regulator [Candidatus Coproplasma sp.]
MQERFKNFTVLITKLNRSIHRIKTQEMAKYNLKSPHVSCLYYLSIYGTLTAKELCDVCEEDKAAVSRSVEYLEQEGFISCNSSAQKRYKAAFVLTEKGKQVAAGIAGTIEKVVDIAGEGICDEDRKTLYACLERIDDNLLKICEKYGE